MAADHDKDVASWSSKLADFLGDSEKSALLVRYCKRHSLTVSIDQIKVPSQATMEKANTFASVPVGWKVSHSGVNPE